MVVNSLSFLAFFGIAFIIYYIVLGKNTKLQNAWLLFMSYVFYGIAECRMIPLLAIATIIFYGFGIAIEKTNKSNEKYASYITTFGISVGVSLLLYFKYLNFFIDSFTHFFEELGFNTNFTTFNIIMPLGISFFTFKLISYVIEVHRGHVKAEHDILAFGTYIAFFPTILSGPIDTPQKFLPQLSRLRLFDYPLAVDGCRQILWGMIKKMILADRLALLLNPIWNDLSGYSSAVLIISMLIYPLQMYFDFSGYSDMAIGIGKLLNIKIAINFKYPFFARNIAEYWRNWHISLTGWLTDYVFIPLNIKFRDLGRLGICLAIVINFTLIGMWHGANWTFAIFGLYHGLLYIPLILNGEFFMKKKLKDGFLRLPLFVDFRNMLLTYLLVAIGLVIFNSKNISQCIEFFYFTIANLHIHSNHPLELQFNEMIFSFTFSGVIILYEWYQRKREYAFELPDLGILKNSWIRFSVYFIITLLVILFKAKPTEFIYFQF